jgi:hypothetical protein
MENKPMSRFDCQNKNGNALSKSPPRAIKPRHFSPLSLANLTPKTLPECEYEGPFFRGAFFFGPEAGNPDLSDN